MNPNHRFHLFSLIALAAAACTVPLEGAGAAGDDKSSAREMIDNDIAPPSGWRCVNHTARGLWYQIHKSKEEGCMDESIPYNESSVQELEELCYTYNGDGSGAEWHMLETKWALEARCMEGKSCSANTDCLVMDTEPGCQDSIPACSYIDRRLTCIGGACVSRSEDGGNCDNFYLSEADHNDCGVGLKCYDPWGNQDSGTCIACEEGEECPSRGRLGPISYGPWQ